MTAQKNAEILIAAGIEIEVFKIPISESPVVLFINKFIKITISYENFGRLFPVSFFISADFTVVLAVVHLPYMRTVML